MANTVIHSVSMPSDKARSAAILLATVTRLKYGGTVSRSYFKQDGPVTKHFLELTNNPTNDRADITKTTATSIIGPGGAIERSTVQTRTTRGAGRPRNLPKHVLKIVSRLAEAKRSDGTPIDYNSQYGREFLTRFVMVGPHLEVINCGGLSRTESEPFGDEVR